VRTARLRTAAISRFEIHHTNECERLKERLLGLLNVAHGKAFSRSAIAV
jgi:hypothetical protein